MKEPGHIYILVNPSIEGFVKIGKTTREPELRAKELSQATGVATPFYVAYSIAVADCHSAEAYVHAVLEHNGFRKSENREFFQMPLQTAIEALLAAQNELAGVTEAREPQETTTGEPECIGRSEEEGAERAVEHPGCALLEQPKVAYYGVGDEIQDKQEALRLLHQAKALDFPAAFSSLAWHYRQEAEKALVLERNRARALAMHDRALGILREGAQMGHARCYVLMADMYLNGLTNDCMEADPGNAAKCWKKYFHSATFLNDDDEKYGGWDEWALAPECEGRGRGLHGGDYLWLCFLDRMPADQEILQILASIRDKIFPAIRREIEWLEQQIGSRPPVIHSMASSRAQAGALGALRRVMGFDERGPTTPPKDPDEESLERRRRFLEYVATVLCGEATK